jgi:hypothetical protein
MIFAVKLPVQPANVAFGKEQAGLDGAWVEERSVGDQ